MTNKELTKDWFSHRVEELVKRDELPYMDAILELCDMFDIEPAIAGSSLISDSIEQHVKREAIELNMYKDKSAALPGM